MLDHHSALIYTMVVASAADQEMTDSEVAIMSDIIKLLPIFKGYDTDRISQTAAECAALLSEVDGIEQIIDLIDEALPERLRETAYALAVDVVAAEIFRHTVKVGRLEAAAIERGAAARFRTL